MLPLLRVLRINGPLKVLRGQRLGCRWIAAAPYQGVSHSYPSGWVLSPKNRGFIGREGLMEFLEGKLYLADDPASTSDGLSVEAGADMQYLMNIETACIASASLIKPLSGV